MLPMSTFLTDSGHPVSPDIKLRLITWRIYGSTIIGSKVIQLLLLPEIFRPENADITMPALYIARDVEGKRGFTIQLTTSHSSLPILFRGCLVPSLDRMASRSSSIAPGDFYSGICSWNPSFTPDETRVVSANRSPKGHGAYDMTRPHQYIHWTSTAYRRIEINLIRPITHFFRLSDPPKRCYSSLCRNSIRTWCHRLCACVVHETSLTFLHWTLLGWQKRNQREFCECTELPGVKRKENGKEIQNTETRDNSTQPAVRSRKSTNPRRS